MLPRDSDPLSRRRDVLHGAVSDLVARLATTVASEGRAACRGGRIGLPRAGVLSRVALSRVVVVGGVGTTSTAWSGCGSLGSTRVRKRGHMSTWPLRCRGAQTRHQ